MFDIGYVTRKYRISEGSRTALSGDSQYIIIAMQCSCVRSMLMLDKCEVNLK